jgi:hypothetical protein
VGHTLQIEDEIGLSLSVVLTWEKERGETETNLLLLFLPCPNLSPGFPAPASGPAGTTTSLFPPPTGIPHPACPPIPGLPLPVRLVDTNLEAGGLFVPTLSSMLTLALGLYPPDDTDVGETER